MCAAFHAAAVHQQVGALDALQGLRVGHSPQPAVMRALCLRVLRSLAQRLGDNPFASALTGKDTDGSLNRTRLWVSGVKFF